jgi:predicted kinase
MHAMSIRSPSSIRRVCSIRHARATVAYARRVATLVLVNGPPASGKSTIVDSLVASRPLALDLDIDVIRAQLGCWSDDPHASGLAARALAVSMATTHLTGGHDVVVAQFLARVGFIEELERSAAACEARFVEMRSSSVDPRCWMRSSNVDASPLPRRTRTLRSSWTRQVVPARWATCMTATWNCSNDGRTRSGFRCPVVTSMPPWRWSKPRPDGDGAGDICSVTSRRGGRISVDTAIRAGQEPIADAATTCVQGQWLLDDVATTALHRALLPGIPVTVTGSQQFTCEGETVEYYINEVLRFEVPGVNVSTAFDTRSAGSFAIDSDPSLGDTITMDYLTVDGGFGPIEGTALDNENNPLDVLVNTPGSEMPAIGGGPIRCDGDTMTILVTSGIASELATFSRIG